MPLTSEPMARVWFRYVSAIGGLVLVIAGIVTAIVQTGVEHTPHVPIRVLLIVGMVAIVAGVGDEWIKEMKLDRARKV